MIIIIIIDGNERIREYRERKRFRLRAGRTERAYRVNNAFGKHRAQTNKTRRTRAFRIAAVL